MNSSVKKNFLYSLILTGANCIFPLLVFPYTTRVLGVTNIGICNFVSSLVNYFILFSMLGISTVGIREIAIKKDDRIQLSKCFSNLFIINTITTCFALIIYIISIIVVPKLRQYSDMMWIGAIQLLFNYLLVDWLYRGLENFRYITIRTIIVRSLYVISVFVFVKEKEDYYLFFLLTSVTIAVNAIINIVYSHNFVFLTFKNLQLKNYIKPIIILGLQAILTSMYTTFNVAYLGFTNDESEVGYYTTATKLFGFAIAFFSALTGVLLPRMSYYVSQKNIGAFKDMLAKTTVNLIHFALPIIVFSMIYAPEIVAIIAGSGYEKAITPMRIVMPLMFIIGYEQILIIQTLMPLGRDKDIIINSIIGASVGLLLNLLLVDRFGSIGTSIVWVVSEATVLITAQYFCNKRVGINFPLGILVKAILYYIPLLVFLYFVHSIIINPLLSIIISSIIMLIYISFIQLFVIKNDLVMGVINKFYKIK